MNNKELPKTYNPIDYEETIYKKWEESGYFNPDNLNCDKDAKSYSIVMPPPNVTGVLHVGHATMLALEDILIRYNRMKGKRTLWIPGTDHASIATTTKVEKILKSEGTNKHELGRDKFLKRLTEFAADSHNTITNQIKKMGSSCDWSREAYTLDKTRSKAVKSTFKLMYDDGLIYRGDRIVNWCPCCQSTLSDDEVEHQNQHTKLYTFKYSKDFPFTISTTRPETKLGDTGVAINLKDKRYNKHLGKTYKIDFLNIPLELKIVADRKIDMEFGSGAVGLTPAHSITDWKIMEENDLKVIKVINEKGIINDSFGEFSRLSTIDARNLIIKKLKDKDLLIDEVDIKNSISTCYRCSTPVEPLPSLQWFINVNKKIKKFDKTIKEICIEAVSSGVFNKQKINIIPNRFEKTYFHWMENLRDWCISRQLWFGHRIPVWYKKDKLIKTEDNKHKEDIYVGVTPPKGEGWIQDEDTLDTWFSSGLWTFSTLANNPDEINIKNNKIEIKNNDYKLFHPNNVLETGHDIIFFWVAKMIIMTTYAVEDIPFQDVYLHGLVLDEHGQKMSKSKGNTINPLDTIKAYGTDATRLSLVIGTTPGNNSKLSDEKIANFRNFTNKLWNISRYIIGTYELKQGNDISKINKITLADKWILNRLNNLILKTDQHIDDYQFSLAGENLKDFCWNDLADWYLEVAKFENTKSKGIILKHILETILKLWHPFMPYITEVIWKELGHKKLLMITNWPTQEKALKQNEQNEYIFEIFRTIIIKIRNARAQFKVSPSTKIMATIYYHENEQIKDFENLIKNLKTGIESINIKKEGKKLGNSVYINVNNIEVFLDIPGLDCNKEKLRLAGDMKNKEAAIKKLKIKLENNNFVNNAPHDIIKSKREKLGEWTEELDQIQTQYNNL